MVLDVTVALKRPGGRRPVILQIIPELGPGGAEQGCVDMAAAIKAAGGRALVASHGGTRHRLHELARAGGEHIDLPVHSKNPWVLWQNIGRLKAIIESEGVDLVHVRSRAPAWSAYEACQQTKTPLVTTCHAPYNTQNSWKKKYNAKIAAGDRVIAISEYVGNYLRDIYGVGDDRLRVISRGIALEKFHPASVTPERMIDVARDWNLPDDSGTIILLPGRLTRWKGQGVLIEAMARLGRKDVFAVLMGSDQGRSDYTEELKALIHQHGLDAQVRIVDHCDDMPAAYMLSRIVVSASIEPEGFGRIPVEGQAMGRLVIATDHGGARETVLPGVTGWLVPPGDVEALAAALRETLDLDHESQMIVGTNAMVHASHKFSRTGMMEKTLAVYNELLPGN